MRGQVSKVRTAGGFCAWTAIVFSLLLFLQVKTERGTGLRKLGRNIDTVDCLQQF